MLLRLYQGAQRASGTLNRTAESFFQANRFLLSALVVSVVESVLSRAIAMPAARFLRMKRSVSLLVSDRAHEGHGAIVEGTYQSPILVQWNRGASRVRTLDVTLTRFV